MKGLKRLSTTHRVRFGEGISSIRGDLWEPDRAQSPVTNYAPVSHSVGTPVVGLSHLLTNPKMADKADDPPPGFQKVKEELWEAVKKTSGPPVNGHTGVYAFHFDDCMCSLGGWPCSREGQIWSCCGQTEKYCRCTKTKDTNKK